MQGRTHVLLLVQALDGEMHNPGWNLVGVGDQTYALGLWFQHPNHWAIKTLYTLFPRACKIINNKVIHFHYKLAET